MGFLQADQLAGLVVQVHRQDLPAVLVDVEAPLGIGVLEADTQVGLDHPDTVQLVAQQR
ncbi:hypothetical protein D3C77_692590 [compost metagenome]